MAESASWKVWNVGGPMGPSGSATGERLGSDAWELLFGKLPVVPHKAVAVAEVSE